MRRYMCYYTSFDRLASGFKHNYANRLMPLFLSVISVFTCPFIKEKIILYMRFIADALTVVKMCFTTIYLFKCSLN